MDAFISHLKSFLPEPIQNALRVVWHPCVSFMSALSSGFPARRMVVVGVNGTKGKSTTCEMLFAILEKNGYKTALASTIRFAVSNTSEANLFKMTMPGRGFVQNFLARAKTQGATHAVIELTTEGAREWRHRFLSLDALVMLNVQKEHIERFGSFEKYIDAKWWLVRELERSRKKGHAVVVNKEGVNAEFLNAKVSERTPFSKDEIKNVSVGPHQSVFVYKDVEFIIPLPGEFNALNALAAIKTAEHLGVPLTVSKEALETLAPVQGRVQDVAPAAHPFRVIVDYAHTPDSLQALYDAFPTQRKVCVLGNTGGGRDTWKRPEMGKIADTMCEEVILTNEDPYDENPEKIIEEMASGMTRKPHIIMDRREAIAAALTKAQPGDVVLVSGKGTDPYIMEAGDKKAPWSDAEVVREELAKLDGKTV